MTTTRRDLLKMAGTLGLAGSVGAVTSVLPTEAAEAAVTSKALEKRCGAGSTFPTCRVIASRLQGPHLITHSTPEIDNEPRTRRQKSTRNHALGGELVGVGTRTGR